MSKLNNVVHNLAHMFIGYRNVRLLKYIESLPIKDKLSFNIDLLEEKISHKQLDFSIAQKYLIKFKKWFINEIKREKIELSDIEKVSIKIKYKPGKSFAKYYSCIAIIKAKGKNYKSKVLSTYVRQ